MRTHTSRRWPIVLLVVGGMVTAAIGVGLGSISATISAQATASQLAQAGFYANAIAIDNEIAGHTGLLSLLDPGAASAASKAAQQTVMAWAAALGRQGKVDEAVALYRSVVSPSLRSKASEALAALLLKTASADASTAQYPKAIMRLQEIATLAPATPAGLQAGKQLPIDQAGEAGLLIAAGRAADAVAILNTVVGEHSAQATRTADSLYPSALLAAAEEDLNQQSYKEALAALQQLINAFPSSAEVAQARAMLAAPQTVTGTLVTHIGVPISDRVRLSSNFKAEPGGMYQTSGPFSYTTSDASGNFTFTNVAIGGPYVLEVFTGGNWTTLINPSTNQPANPVTVSPLTPVDLTFVVLPS